MGRLRRSAVRATLVATVVATVLASLLSSPVAAAEPTFGKPTIDSAFGRGVELTQPVVLTASPFRVEVLLTTGEDGTPLVVEVPSPGAGTTTLRYTLDVSEGNILPNTPVTARWRITQTQDADPLTGPPVSALYEDDRFDWQTVEGDIVRVHWYEGSRAFGERALRIGEEAVASTAARLGVTEDARVDFFIYADQTSFYDALGPGTRENVGGQANADIRTLFALITPTEIDDPWVATVVPHELVHLVFDTAVQNPYHFPPRWLNEGLAVYLSQGYEPGDRSAVERAARNGELLPLDGLAGQFPTTADGFFLAYAESVSAVDFFVRTHGEEALVALIASYADGRTDDEAFSAAIGQDVAAFNAAWLADLGASAPVRYGPRPAPPGPQPSAWTAAGSGPPTPAPGASSPGTASPGATRAPGVPGDGSGSSGGGSVLLYVVSGLVLAGAVALVVARRRGREPVTP